MDGRGLTGRQCMSGRTSERLSIALPASQGEREAGVKNRLRCRPLPSGEDLTEAI
jgi:hypothetical protein